MGIMHKYVLLIVIFVIIPGFTTQMVTLQGLKPDWIRYYSLNKEYCFEFIPSYSEQATDSTNMGTFYKVKGKNLQQIWSMNMAPALVLLSNDGKYVVIFNTWMPKSLDDTVVCIYNELGHRMKGIAVKDIIGDNPIYRLPLIELYPFFGQGHYIDHVDNCLVLDVVFDVPIYDYQMSVRREHIMYRYYFDTEQTIAESATQCYFPYSRIQRIHVDGLSLSQIESAIAEIYLRHRQVPYDISIYRSPESRLWYSRNDNLSAQSLNNIEKWNVERLQKQKKRYETYIPDTIIFSLSLDNYYIIYTGSTSARPYQYCMYICSTLCTLGELNNRHEGSVLIDDASSPLSLEQIKLFDLNYDSSKCTTPEILINRVGPSSQYSQVCLGFDKKGNFIRYYHIGGIVKEFEKTEREIVFIKTCRLMSYYTRYEQYAFDVTTFSLVQLNSDEFYISSLNTSNGKHTTKAVTIRALEVFPGRWLEEWEGQERFYIPAGDTVQVEKYSTCCGGMFLISYKNEYGWVTEKDIDMGLDLIHSN